MRIDFRIAGLGDAWMRLMALATLARIRDRERHVAYPPALLVPLARRVFEDRFDVETGGPADIEMSHLGLRHLLPGILKGKRYYAPFYWILRATRTETTLKDKVNDLGFLLACASGRVMRPSRRLVFEYQGFVEMQGLKPFRDVTAEEFVAASRPDLDAIHARVLSVFGSPGSAERTVVFPSGAAHQIVPPEVAARLLPAAEYAFHEKDGFSMEYEQAGLKVIRFGAPAEEILRTDRVGDGGFHHRQFSFPSGADVAGQDGRDADGNEGRDDRTPCFSRVPRDSVRGRMPPLPAPDPNRPRPSLPGGTDLLRHLGESRLSWPAL